MKAKTFENLIRKVVREEIDYALRREIKTLKEDLRESQNYELKPKSIIPPQKSLKEDIMGSKPINQIPQIKRNFTNNSTLNDLLNETAQGDTRMHEGTSPVSMDGGFSSIGDLPVEAAPQEVVNAVTRDYSDLMKAIDNKKKRP